MKKQEKKTFCRNTSAGSKIFNASGKGFPVTDTGRKGTTMSKLVCKSDVRNFVRDVQNVIEAVEAASGSYEEKIKAFRSCFFRHFFLSDKVPSSLVPTFIRFSEKFYDKSSVGYTGIIEEIADRVILYSEIDGFVLVREFLKHGEGKTDIYDKENRTSYEKKTGCGDWLRSEKYNTFEEVIQEYRRKRTLIRWDYDYIPTSEDMTGKKSVNKSWTEEDKAKAQERTKTKKNGEKVVNKQYEIHIHIETTYKNLLDYMDTYPAGLKTFFKESKRSGVAGVYVWELQTLKNSKKKIDFLQNCPYNTAKPKKTEEEEEE